MIRKILPIAAVMAVAAMPFAAQAKGHIVLKSVHVNLPATGKMFPGPNASAINGNCVACHSIDMIYNQPNMSKGAWEAEVAKMRNVYKAPVDAKDVGPIVEYLTKIKGTH